MYRLGRGYFSPPICAALCLAAALACTPRPPSHPDASSPAITKQQAIGIATSFLRQQAFADDYLFDNPVATQTRDDKKNWLVVFKHVDWESLRPGRGIVMVDRATGTAKWVPAR